MNLWNQFVSRHFVSNKAKGWESQNGCFQKTKHAKFTPYTHRCVNWTRTKFALLPYYRRLTALRIINILLDFWPSKMNTKCPKTWKYRTLNTIIIEINPLNSLKHNTITFNFALFLKNIFSTFDKVWKLALLEEMSPSFPKTWNSLF